MASESSMDVDASAGAQQPERRSWRPRQPRLVAHAGATSSSTSGGSLSTTYTSGSSHLQSCSSGDGGLAPPVALLSTRVVKDMLEDEPSLFPWLQLGKEKERTCGHINRLVHQFSAAGSNDDLVLWRWLRDLGVGWVLDIASLHARHKRYTSEYFTRSWIIALTVIQFSISACFVGLCNCNDHEEGAFSSVAAVSEFARFLQSTLLKMLPFTDALVSAKVNGPCIQRNLWEAMVPAEEKLQALTGVRNALSEASGFIKMWSICPSFEGSCRDIFEHTSSLLSAKLAELDEAIWDTVDEVRTSIISMTGNHSEADSVDSQERSPYIHRVTRSAVNFIKLLSSDYLSLYHIFSNLASLGKYVPQDNRMGLPFDPLAMLIAEMISCLQENLARVSQSFSDQSMRFMFLLNNTNLMWQHIGHPSYGLAQYMPALDRKVDDYIHSYLQMSWIQVMSGLQDPTPLCLGRYSPLTKFELEFQKTYTTQKLWKVPDPELRRRLRKAIIETVSPVFTKYLEDNRITAPRVTLQELEDMLQDLFEG
ncbi:unnamed protein product [Urochloa humidicola]